MNNYVKTRKATIIGKGRQVQAVRKDGTLLSIWLCLTETKWGDDHLVFCATIQLMGTMNKALS
ncbi:hypothetical protein OFN27_31210, partial [Escherichia coli]|nr:hypothetical protein [Escherichia coli]